MGYYNRMTQLYDFNKVFQMFIFLITEGSELSYIMSLLKAGVCVITVYLYIYLILNEL